MTPLSVLNVIKYAFKIRTFSEELTFMFRIFLCTDIRHALALEPQNKAGLLAERRLQKKLR